MSDLVSAAWFALTLAGVAWIGVHGTGKTAAKPSQPERSAIAAGAVYARTPSGERGVVDANGYVVPVRHYTRIASASSLADELLLALVEPERIHALSEYGREHSAEAHLYGARLPIVGMQQFELLVEQRVDLLLLNHLRSHAELTRLREAGIQVFNLGEMRGLSSLLPNIAAVAALIGEPERGRRYADTLTRRMRMVAADIPRAKQKRALYVSVYANQMFGGAPGTSYHDVLLHAGLIDAAQGKYEGWPRFDPEQLLELDPELIVANEGTGDALCRVAGLARLRACQNERVIMLPTDLLGDPGPRMIEAAEALRDAVYGPHTGGDAN